jgi:hypothetical protein
VKDLFGFVLIMSLLGLPGVVLLGVGIYKGAALRSFLSHADTATGRVVAFTPLRSHEDGTTYGLVVEYPDPSGPSRRFSVETENPHYSVGQDVEVLYRTIQPPEARVRGIDTTWGTPVIFTIVGFCWASFAGFILAVTLRHRSSADHRLS